MASRPARFPAGLELEEGQGVAEAQGGIRRRKSFRAVDAEAIVCILFQAAFGNDDDVASSSATTRGGGAWEIRPPTTTQFRSSGTVASRGTGPVAEIEPVGLIGVGN